MDNIEIIRYSKSLHSSLFEYIKKTFPSYSDEYTSYCLDNSIDNMSEGTAFVALKNDKIVGCHMFYNTRAFINGQIVNTRWGHDTYIDEDCRKDLSIKFIVEINKIPAFGIGVSDANKKIQESIRTRFIKGLFTYCIPTFYSTIYNLKRNKRIESFKAPYEITTGFSKFHEVDNAKQITILNDGYWYKDLCNVDFVRDEEFLNNRFFNNKAFNYNIYTADGLDCYFVVRPIVFHNIPSLLLVDFRYDTRNPFIIGQIIKACKKIACENSLGSLVLLSNDNNIGNYLKKRIVLKRETNLLANRYLKLHGDILSNITAADADVDYMYH